MKRSNIVPTSAVLLLGAHLLAGCFSSSPQFVTSPLAKPAVDRLLSSDQLLQRESVVEISSLGEGAMPELASRFQSASPMTRIQILELAVTIGSPDVLVTEIFSQAAKDPQTAVRYAAATSAAKLPQHASSLSEVMRSLLDDSSADIRATALTTLAGFPGPPQPDAAELLRLLRDRHAIVAATASNLALKRREPYVQAAARATLPRLIGALQDIHPSTRAACLFAIGQFGLAASPAIGPITHVLEADPVPEVRLQAALSLLRIGTPEAATTAKASLADFVKDPNPVISNAAKAAL